MIKEFQKEYRWLSNFYPAKIQVNEITYPSVEHAYQSAKCANFQDCRKFLDGTPGDAKRLGKMVELRSDWEQVKVLVMTNLLGKKFRLPEFKKKLLDTGDEILQEGNNWYDTFWGVDLKTGRGKNTLGKLLMELRTELRKEDANPKEKDLWKLCIRYWRDSGWPGERDEDADNEVIDFVIAESPDACRAEAFARGYNQEAGYVFSLFELWPPKRPGEDI